MEESTFVESQLHRSPSIAPNPLVSVIVPCYNEERTIGLLLEALRTQTYPIDRMEVIISDGKSTDHTCQRIREFGAAHPEMQLRTVENQQRTIPSGLNRALEAALGEVVVRLDAHAIPRPDYVERSVSALQAGRGDNVGGVWEIRPGGTGWQARSVAAAAAHPLGVGDARYRYTGQAAVVDTVPFGAFYRSLVERIGPFDEELLTNEDYEFNTRLRGSGGRVWLDPAIRSAYFARPSFGSLARQYARYGYWKARMLRRYPGSLRWRQALPPAFVLSLLFLVPLAIFFSPARLLLAIVLLAYILALLAAGAYAAAKKKDPALLFGLPVAIATMHLSWGSAFLVSWLDLLLFKKWH